MQVHLSWTPLSRSDSLHSKKLDAGINRCCKGGWAIKNFRLIRVNLGTLRGLLYKSYYDHLFRTILVVYSMVRINLIYLNITSLLDSPSLSMACSWTGHSARHSTPQQGGAAPCPSWDDSFARRRKILKKKERTEIIRSQRRMAGKIVTRTI